MIVKLFRYGTGEGSAVFDYLLSKEGGRSDAEILRGDVYQQKLLIDSLDFKPQYTNACLIFLEDPNTHRMYSETLQLSLNNFTRSEPPRLYRRVTYLSQVV